MSTSTQERDTTSYQPVKVVDTNIEHATAELAATYGPISIVDEYKTLLEDVFLLRNPQFKFNPNYQKEFEEFCNTYLQGKTWNEMGSWFFYPWSKQLVHFLPEAEHLEMRTGRNRNLITEEEQQKYYGSVIGVLGMSVGSHVALTIAITGGPKHMKLADPDVLGGSNINRIRTGYQNIGISKCILVARQVYEINPYAELELFLEGITAENMETFLSGLTVLVEEMDNPVLKLVVREHAKQKGIAVVMATDSGDGILVDVERFDAEPDRAILHGLVGDMKIEEMGKLPPPEMLKTIGRLAGISYANLRTIESLLSVGKTLYSWPQLGTAANMCGSVIAMLVRKISVGEQIASGRYMVDIEQIFTKPSEEVSKRRDELLNTYFK